MKLTIQYYAELAEVAGCSEEILDTVHSDLSHIYAELQRRHGFRFTAATLKPVQNNVLVAWDTPVTSGDVLAFLPPFSGG
jgi:molybdopterin converting factor small subunit